MGDKQTSIFRLLLICSFLSGCAALVYEILWVRLFSLIFGHTTLAVSTVVAAFMAGLAWGSLKGGRLADKGRWNLLRTYALVELGLGILGLVSRSAIGFVETTINHLAIGEWMFWYQSLGWFAVLFLLLLPPTFLMGVTLPLLVVWSKKTATSPSQNMASLYGINTAGAALGTLLAGLFLPPFLGIAGTLRLAAFLNILAASIAFYCAKVQPSLAEESEASSPPALLAIVKPHIRVCIIAGLSGLAALIFEIAWTRALALVIGSSIYAFTIMLFTFLIGLALGSLAFRVWARRYFVTLNGLGLVQYGIALLSLASLVLLGFLPYVFMRLYPLLSRSFQALEAGQFLLSGLIIFVPTFLMGLALPWAFRLIEQESFEGRRLGWLYATNTVGSILGSVLGGFLLLPWLGIEKTLLIGVGVNTLAFIVAWGNGLRNFKKASLLGIALLGLLSATVAAPRWNKTVMSSGMFIYADDYDPKISYKKFVRLVSDDRILYYKDGISATIAVLENSDGSRYLRTNGKTDASSASDMETQLLLGYVPLFLHRQPRKALVIGFGSGSTLGTVASALTIERADLVEIEPAVLSAAPYFSQENRNVLKNPKVHVFVTDARHWLEATHERYDVIISEPSNPWIAGVANLYSQEAFRLAKKALAPSGIFCQWFHSYSMSERDFKMVLNTFLSVFPNAQVFNVSNMDLLILGINGNWDIDYKRVAEALETTPAARASLAPYGLDHPHAFLTKNFMLANEDLRAYLNKETMLNTDDRPILEFSAPRNLHSTKEQQEIADHLAEIKSFSYPDGLRNLPKR